MKDNMVFHRSSFLVSLPFMGVNLLLCVLAAFFGQGTLAALLMFLFLMAAVSRAWAFASARKLTVTVSGAAHGMFPGETTNFELEIQNGKFLPVIWMEVFFPLARNLCLTPDSSREPDEWELSMLGEEGASEQLVGEKKFSFLMWYETLRFSTRWTAKCRGVYSIGGWRLRTGDGFGLAQIERKILGEGNHQFAVYPKLIRVKPDLFLRNLWNADTGTRGVMEDTTVIRSTRDYQTTDSLKHINWRLAARGLPLTVNVYEDILPKNVHFLFDGESFSGPEPHLEEMEDALSVLASELVRLEEAQVQCGLSLSQGNEGTAVNLFNAGATEELLCALAAYHPMKLKIDTESNKVLAQPPIFHEGPIYEAVQRVGRFYYIAYDTSRLGESKLLRRLDRTCTSILTYLESEPYGEFETIGLCHLKEDATHE